MDLQTDESESRKGNFSAAISGGDHQPAVGEGGQAAVQASLPAAAHEDCTTVRTDARRVRVQSSALGARPINVGCRKRQCYLFLIIYGLSNAQDIDVWS